MLLRAPPADSLREVPAELDGDFVADLALFAGALPAGAAGLEARAELLRVVPDDFEGAFAVDFSGAFAVDFEGAFAVDFEGAFAVDFEGAFAVDFEGAFAVDFEGAFAVDFEGALRVDFEGALRVDFAGAFAVDFAGVFRAEASPGLVSPRAAPLRGCAFCDSPSRGCSFPSRPCPELPFADDPWPELDEASRSCWTISRPVLMTPTTVPAVPITLAMRSRSRIPSTTLPGKDLRRFLRRIALPTDEIGAAALTTEATLPWPADASWRIVWSWPLR